MCEASAVGIFDVSRLGLSVLMRRVDAVYACGQVLVSFGTSCGSVKCSPSGHELPSGRFLKLKYLSISGSQRWIKICKK